MQTNLIIYNDVKEFGGHEVLTLHLIKYLLQEESCKIHFICSARNKKLLISLNILMKEVGRDFNITAISYSSGKLQLLRTFLSIIAILRVRKKIKQIAPGCVLVAQGEISLSTVGILAAKLSGIKVVSYIPMAHSRVKRGDRYFPKLKDRILSFYYSLPSAFITISKSVQQELIGRGALQSIKVVHNGIDIDSYEFVEKADARKKLGLEENEYIIGLVGRIEFNQKQQDLFIKVMAKRKHELQNTKILMVGNGPDEVVLDSLIKNFGMQDYVEILPWHENLSDVYSAIDLIAIPSKFEGLPIVMLEAMLYKLPVIASNVDGMAEILPREWLFDCRNEEEIWETFKRVSNGDNDKCLNSHYELVKKYYSIENFRKSFYDELSSICS